MNIVTPDVEVLTPLDGDFILKHIERCGRVSYKSEDKITEDSAARFVEMIIRSGHESVLEHYSISVIWTCDRATANQLVRHRLASYTQESTRYCNYSMDKFGNAISVIRPCGVKLGTLEEDLWEEACKQAEDRYMELLRAGVKPETARSILPQCTKTEIAITMNLREWRHFFKLRCDIHAQEDIRRLALQTLKMFCEKVPVVFNGI